MSIYERLAATSRRLLEQFGTSAVLTRTTPGSYDPATGATGAATTTTYACYAARFDYAQHDIDGTLVRAGDQRIYLDVQDTVMPRTGDTMTLGGRTYTVVTARAIDPALTAVLYEVQARGLS